MGSLRISSRGILLTVLALVLLYVGSYALLSDTGGWVVTESGDNRPWRLATCDCYKWQPRYGSCERFHHLGGEYSLRADFLDYLYSPLILLDQAWIHPTIFFLNAQGDLIEPLPSPKYSEYHPLRENRFCGRFPYTKAGE